MNHDGLMVFAVFAGRALSRRLTAIEQVAATLAGYWFKAETASSAMSTGEVSVVSA